MKTTRLLPFVVTIPLILSAAAASADPNATVLRFERKYEPNQRAFSFLIPVGWQIQGGMFHVDPTQAGGAGNSLDAKCDLTIKKDDGGTVAFRWLPGWNYVDMSRNPQMAMSAAMFPAGSRYQGMEVRPMPSCAQYLRATFNQMHPTASDVKVIRSESIPQLAQIFRLLYKSVDDQQRMLGFPPLGYDAGGLVVEYAEGGRRFREAVATCLVDMRPAAAIWSNQYTLAIRAPADETKTWKPVLEIIRQSMRFNPQWLAAAVRAAGERGQILDDTMKAIQNIDQQVYANRSKTNAEIQHENYLFLTTQEEYVNPFSGAVEQDTAEYKYRWTTEQGEMIYTDLNDYNPNRQLELSNRTWKLTPVRQR